MHLYGQGDDGNVKGLKGAELGGELSPELLGVGYIIGPKVSCLMMAGAVLSYFVLGPFIVTIGEKLDVAVSPATVLAPMAGVTDTVFRRFIRNLGGCGLIMTEFTSSHGVSAALRIFKLPLEESNVIRK